MKVHGQFLSKTQVGTRDWVGGTRAVTRDLDWLARALTRGEQRHLLRIETPVPTHHTLAVRDLILPLIMENILSEISLRNIGVILSNIRAKSGCNFLLHKEAVETVVLLVGALVRTDGAWVLLQGVETGQRAWGGEIECYNNLLLFSTPQLAFYFDVMVSFYFPDEIKVPTVDITFVVEQSVFQKNVFSWKVKVISFRIKFWFWFEENILMGTWQIFGIS